MPKRQPPKNSTWVQLTKDFVKEWPEVLDGLHFQNMPVKYLMYVNIILKNNITIHYDIAKELRKKKQATIARFLKETIEKNYLKINIISYLDKVKWYFRQIYKRRWVYHVTKVHWQAQCH